MIRYSFIGRLRIYFSLQGDFAPRQILCDGLLRLIEGADDNGLVALAAQCGHDLLLLFPHAPDSRLELKKQAVCLAAARDVRDGKADVGDSGANAFPFRMEPVTALRAPPFGTAKRSRASGTPSPL